MSSFGSSPAPTEPSSHDLRRIDAGGTTAVETVEAPLGATDLNKADSIFNSEDAVTIAEARKRLEPNAPTRDAFHKAIKRGKLKKLPAIADERDFRIRWADILDYIAGGGFQNRGSISKSLPRVAASPEDGVSGSLSTTLLLTSGATTTTDNYPDAEFIEVQVVQEKSGNGPLFELDEVEKLLADLPGFTEEVIIRKIKSFAGRAEELADNAIAVGSRALICAWACGTMFNKIKAECQHGQFGPWLESQLNTVGLSSRTCQRYMKLARKWKTLAELVESQPGLKDAYVACGIIPEPKDSPCGENDSSDGGTTEGSDDPSAARRLLSCVNTLQKRLHGFTTSGETLDPQEMNQLGGVITDLTRYYEQLQQQ